MGHFEYSHPLFDTAAVEAQKKLHLIQGKNRIWFCGAWTGYGFHEDGLRSGLDVARSLGGLIPWESDEVLPFRVAGNQDTAATYALDAAE